MRRAPADPKATLAWLAAGSFALFLTGCPTEPAVEVVPGTAVEHGRWLFEAAGAGSATNPYACATCHADLPSAVGSRILPGAPLAGVLQRPSLWGGAVEDPLAAINHCRKFFQQATVPWQPDDLQARALYAWLETLPAALPDAVTWSVVGPVQDVPPGDPAVGSKTYANACRSCHGDAHTGKGRLTTTAPKLPEQFLSEHAAYTPQQRRLVFIEKVRHGVFYGYGGTMPPFAREVLDDAALSGLLTWLGL